MHTIRTSHVTQVGLLDLKPGCVTVEGVVLEKSMTERSYTTTTGRFLVDPDQTVAVLARVDRDLLDRARKAASRASR